MADDSSPPGTMPRGRRGIHKRRRTEAARAKGIREAVAAVLRAEAILVRTIVTPARQTPAATASTSLTGPLIPQFVSLQPFSARNGTLRVEVLRADDTPHGITLARRRDAAMDKAAGLRAVPACNRDGAFCERHGPERPPTRTQPMMGDAPPGNVRSVQRAPA